MRPSLLVLLAGLTLLGAGCGTAAPPVVLPAPGGAQPPAAGTTAAELEAGGLVDGAVVSMGPAGFSPATISVRKGRGVVWLNEDPGGPHRPVADDAAPSPFDGGSIATGDAWSFTFDAVGTWTYHDGLHPSNKGTIVVE